MSVHNMRLTANKLNCKRFRLQDPNGENVYVIVAVSDDGAPLQVKASFVNEADHAKKETLSTWTLACNLVSRSLSSGIKVNEVLEDLKLSRVFPRDVPSQMFEVLNNYA